MGWWSPGLYCHLLVLGVLSISIPIPHSLFPIPYPYPILNPISHPKKCLKMSQDDPLPIQQMTSWTVPITPWGVQHDQGEGYQQSMT